MAIERYGSKSDALIKLGLVFFISLLSFSIGTYVGKKYSDNSHRLAQLEPKSGASHEVAEHGDEESAHERDPASIQENAHEPHKKELSTEDLSKLTEEFIADEESVEVAKEDSHKDEPAKGDHAKEESKKDEHAKEEVAHKDEPTKDESAVSAEPAQKVAAVTPDKAKSILSPVAQKIIDKAKDEAEERKPSAIPEKLATVVRGKFTVQVGSYNNEAEAAARAAELKKENLSAFYTSAQVRGKTWYRVAVGLFNSSQEAQSFLSDLKEKQIITSALVQRVQ